jgi:hypothetical protein
MRETLAVAALLLAAYSSQALAAEPWQFRLIPYLWLAGLKGDVATIPPLPTAPVDVSPSDALSGFEGGGMILLDARKGRHGFLVDLLYTDIRSDFELVPAPINLNMKSISKTTIATLAYQYQLYGQDQTVVDLLAGARYWNIDSELRFSGGLGVLAGRTVSHTESWVDPGVGIKGRVPFGNSRFYFEGAAGIGGFGVGSDLFYEANLNVGYQWSKSIGTTIGYRMFDVDYEKDRFLYDVRQEGLQLGLSWSF